MKNKRKLIILVILVLTMVMPQGLPVSDNIKVAEAATIKISKKTLSLEVGKTSTLIITGTKEEVTWTSNKKAVATVTSKGKVTAKEPGTATITASVDGKKLNCKLSVKAATNKYLKDAPFDAVEKIIGDISIVIPKNYKCDLEENSDTQYSLTLFPSEIFLDSNISISINKTGLKAEKYDVLKEQFSDCMTKNFYQGSLETSYSPAKIKINEFVNSDFKANLGYAFKTKCNFSVDGYKLPIVQYIYGFDIDNYSITVFTTDIGQFDFDTIAEYIINSIIVIK
ncbi:MAG: Ig-like domain-containing protein [Mobilitalea sp.]